MDNEDEKNYTGLKQMLRQLLTMGELDTEVARRLMVMVDEVYAKIIETMKKGAVK